MKRIYLGILGLLLLSCGNKQSSETESFEETTTAVKPAEPKAEGNKSLPGYAAIQASDCLSCHKDNGKMIGPSYAEIAERYTEKDKKDLATKIVKGSSGVWGSVPMSAHPNMSEEEAIKMVEYILSFKK